MMLRKKINPELKINNILLVSISIGNGLTLAIMKYGPTALRKGLTKKQRQSTKKVATSSNKITKLVFKLTKEEQEKIIFIKKGIYLFVPSILILLVDGYALINENFDVTYLLFILITIVISPSAWACYDNEIDTFHRKQNYFFTINQLLSGNRESPPAELDTFPEK